MKFLKKILKLILGVFAIPIIYLLISLLLTSITVNESEVSLNANKTIYLNTNGVHLDVIIPVSEIDNNLKKGLKMKDEKYLSFGWGDENFYLYTPTWSDLTFNNAFNDDFYKAKGSYSCLKTCNSWVNSALKMSDLKCCYWTPFDFGIINKYKS